MGGGRLITRGEIVGGKEAGFDRHDVWAPEEGPSARYDALSVFVEGMLRSPGSRYLFPETCA